jgi:hypothetical protein
MVRVKAPGDHGLGNGPGELMGDRHLIPAG